MINGRRRGPSAATARPANRVALAASVILIGYAVAGAARSTSAQVELRAGVFLQAFETYYAAWKAKELGDVDNLDAWIAPESPWAPYLAKPFSDGLNESNKLRDLNAQERGDCKEFLALQRNGVLNLYPFLQPAFERNVWVGRIFSAYVVAGRHPGSTRCKANELLNRAGADFARRGKPPDIVDTTALTKAPAGRRYSDKAEADWCLGMSLLYQAAIDKDFAPAQRDVLKLIADPVRLILLPLAEYYLLERARHRLLAIEDAKARYARLQSNLEPKVRERVERAARIGDAASAELPYWGCPRLRAKTP